MNMYKRPSLECSDDQLCQRIPRTAHAGLGKTMQAIALVSYLVQIRKEQGPYLVVAPASVLPHWFAEFRAFSPGVTVHVYQGTFDERSNIWNTKVLSFLNALPTYLGMDASTCAQNFTNLCSVHRPFKQTQHLYSTPAPKESEKRS